MLGLNRSQFIAVATVFVCALTFGDEPVFRHDYASQLRTVWWRLFDKPSEIQYSKLLVMDAQAMLIRASVLASGGQETNIAEVVQQASLDFKRIASSGTDVDHRYLPGEVLARADLSLSWLLQGRREGIGNLKQRAEYVVAFASVAIAAENRALQQEDVKIKYSDSTITIGEGDAPWSSPFMRPLEKEENYPVFTREARKVIIDDLVTISTKAKMTWNDFDQLILTFEKQSLAGSSILLMIQAQCQDE